MQKQHILNIFIVLAISLFVISCEKSPEKEKINGKLTSFTNCKSFKNFYASDSVASNYSCAEFTYVNNTLSITHINAGFNCCPGSLDADISFANDTITISEYETESACDCNCLYDLEFEIYNLETSVYHIVFDEPYIVSQNEELNFNISLIDSVQGSFCVERSHYPWGL